jgi:hypothetical protein
MQYCRKCAIRGLCFPISILALACVLWALVSFLWRFPAGACQAGLCQRGRLDVHHPRDTVRESKDQREGGVKASLESSVYGLHRAGGPPGPSFTNSADAYMALTVAGMFCLSQAQRAQAEAPASCSSPLWGSEQISPT